jgi:hypothetical protein
MSPGVSKKATSPNAGFLGRRSDGVVSLSIVVGWLWLTIIANKVAKEFSP